jgi:hypothetical protein
MQKVNVYKLPSTGAARELLREKGQFWTPDWVAEAMVEYVFADKGGMLFDPAVGAGAFFRAAKVVAKERGLYYSLSGMDIDSKALDEAIQYGLSKDDIANVKIGDFVFQSPQTKLSAIVANPPYIRHHRLSLDTKEKLKRLSMQSTGTILDGRAGFHVYFLIRALTLLEENGRLAFIMPADTCEGKFSHDLWRWISANYCVDAVIAFAPEASPFPNVDTNPLVFFIRKAAPENKFIWAKCYESKTETFKLWVRSGFEIAPKKSFVVFSRDLAEGLQTGFSRPPVTEKASKYVLGDFVQIMRGVATGANEFFFLTHEQVNQLEIPDKYFVRAIGRTRDVSTEEITQKTLEILREKGRPTLLLSLNGEPFENYPEKLKKYLKEGESLGLPQKPLISQRKPWYKTEVRSVPPFLFAYLGRRNVRFIRNTAKIIPLTGFLCVYPKSDETEFNERLWKILNHPDTISNLALIGKSYGDGAVKVEPRSLEKLQIPDRVIEESGLPVQMRLFEKNPDLKITTYPTRKRKSVKSVNK